jgi:hypothetical protein
MGQLFNRVLTAAGGQMPVASRQAMGFVGTHLDPLVIATDAARVLTVDDISRGGMVFTGFTAGRNLTTPAAAAILAAAVEMDIGDSFLLVFSVTTAFAGTWVAGAGVTLLGRATVPASATCLIVVKKLTATTVSWTSF